MDPRPAGQERRASPVQELQLVCFRMGGEEFALSIMRIREIVRPQRIARVPRAPAFVEGVINLRGTILPVVDLRRRLGIPHDPDERRARFLVVGLEQSLVVFVVDEVKEVIRAPRDAVLPAPALVRGVDASYLLGVLPVGERLVMLLHPERVLTAAETADLRAMQAELAAGRGEPGEAAAAGE
ncbi:MAG TPA: chemotaxis protein CheW [Thermodesulfobacteriota bacterium]|nr:chemotaxis protein CheW [Thermodesulfobacteriota bacterium]